jgi:hypothetical protein
MNKAFNAPPQTGLLLTTSLATIVFTFHIRQRRPNSPTYSDLCNDGLLRCPYFPTSRCLELELQCVKSLVCAVVSNDKLHTILIGIKTALWTPCQIVLLWDVGAICTDDHVDYT